MIDLHLHSSYSLLDAWGLPHQIVSKCKELGRKAVAITDHDNVYALPLLQDLCEKEDMKPIFGCELRFIEDIKENRKEKCHITLLAKNYTGYKNLMHLVTAAHHPDCFYYYPTIDLFMLKECSEGIIVLSACIQGIINSYILNNNLEGAVKMAKWFKDVFGDNFYLEIMPHEMDEINVITPVLRAIHVKYDIPLVLTNDVHFLNKDQYI